MVFYVWNAGFSLWMVSIMNATFNFKKIYNFFDSNVFSFIVIKNMNLDPDPDIPKRKQ
jgi:hypothetical protein